MYRNHTTIIGQSQFPSTIGSYLHDFSLKHFDDHTMFLVGQSKVNENSLSTRENDSRHSIFRVRLHELLTTVQKLIKKITLCPSLQSHVKKDLHETSWSNPHVHILIPSWEWNKFGIAGHVFYPIVVRVMNIDVQMSVSNITQFLK